MQGTLLQERDVSQTHGERHVSNIQLAVGSEDYISMQGVACVLPSKYAGHNLEPFPEQTQHSVTLQRLV